MSSKPNQKAKKVETLSEQDLELKTKLEGYVQSILTDIDAKDNLDRLKQEVRTATTSMTSVPKPFKFLKDSYQKLVDHYNSIQTTLFKKQLADFISVLSMTYGQERDALKYLQEGTLEEFMAWGHEYLSHLASDIGKEYNIRMQDQAGADDLLKLVEKIIPQFMEHNQEHEAIDLLMEVEKLDELTQFVQKQNSSRILIYLLSLAPFTSDKDELDLLLNTAFKLCMKVGEFTNALKVALRIDKQGLVESVFQECLDPLIRKQLAFQVARHRYLLPEEFLDQELNSIASNHKLSQFYLHLAKDLDVVEPKTPEQVYKAHLEDRLPEIPAQSLQQNIAATYVNAFVNAGFKVDALFENEKDPWVNKLKEDGKTAGVASIGMINLWNIDSGTSKISGYLDITDQYTQVGTSLAYGLFCNGIVDENQPALALLREQLESAEQSVRQGAAQGLGIAYAGSGKAEILELLVPLVVNSDLNVDVSAMAALSLGLVFVGKCNEDASNAILQAMMERLDSQLETSIARYFAVGLGLVFLGQSESADGALEALGAVSNQRMAKYARATILSFAYASTGNVLKVQELLGLCHENVKENNDYQQAAILGIALIAGSEDVGSEMVHRIFQHILQFSDINVKRAIPLAVALINISSPKIQPMDLLLKLAHDPDQELSHRAILGLGLLGAGTNNSRIADILRGLASFCVRDPNGLFLVRISQGLLYMGKGCLTLQPYYSDKFLLNKVQISGIVTLLHGCLDITNLILKQYHTLFFYLGLSMYPRSLFTLDKDLNNQPVQVRVGQAVDAVGQAGKPKRITGFQTHTSPVIISTGERAELANEEFIPVQDIVLENFVILKENPDYKPEVEQTNNRKKTSFNM